MSILYVNQLKRGVQHFVAELIKDGQPKLRATSFPSQQFSNVDL